MNNVIQFDQRKAQRKRVAVINIQNNVVQFADWKKPAQTIRTPNGVFFATSAAQYARQAA